MLCYPLVATADQQDRCSENCTFVLLSEHSAKWQVINESRADLAISPYSTFKIANSLIALELGVVRDLEQKLTFDKSKYPVQSWWPESWYKLPLDLHHAFAYSAVPIYRQIAATVGPKTMQSYLNRFHYGNQDISSGIDKFWLNGSLKVSAREQVAFIRKIMTNQLPISPKTLKALKKMMLTAHNDDFKLYAKTGSGKNDKGNAIGWLVGFVENAKGLHYFALNLEGRDFSSVRLARITLAKHYLQQAGVI